MNKNNLAYHREVEDQWLRRFEDCLNSLSAQTAHRLKSFMHKDILAESPLFNMKGRSDVVESIKYICESLGVSKVKVVDISVSSEMPHIFYVRWEMKTNIKGGSYVVSAMSEYTTEMKTGLIIHQKDFWNPDPIFQQISAAYRWGWKRVVKKL
jgi:hypothetical protein